VWFDPDGDVVIFTKWHTSVKASSLQRDPRISLCLDDERRPFRFVLIRTVANASW
jgi:hypothetical protein